MTLGGLIERINFYVSKIKTDAISESIIKSMIQEGADDICRITQLFPSDTKFDIKEDVYRYSLNEIDEDFLNVDKQGLFFNEGTGASPDWEPLTPSTDIKMENEFRNWRNDSSADPQRYWVKQNSLYIHPKPSADLTDGGWLYFCKRPPRMTDNGDYPFTGTNTSSALFDGFDESIMLYCQWKLEISEGGAVEDLADTKKSYYDSLLIQDSILNRKKPFSEKGKWNFARIPSISKI